MFNDVTIFFGAPKKCPSLIGVLNINIKQTKLNAYKQPVNNIAD